MEHNSFKDLQNIPGVGEVIVDATCTPADIAYPTDLSLLNEAREKSEAIIEPCTNRLQNNEY
ncbi:MAG: hypothetical protein ACYTFK_06860 [Planctomycetota bacterium]|jgi:hypothetical protein